jgi:hypothetical protein
MMLSVNLVNALKIIHNRLDGKDIDWAVTGSTAFILQGIQY